MHAFSEPNHSLRQSSFAKRYVRTPLASAKRARDTLDLEISFHTPAVACEMVRDDVSS
jgi:hypothetical protein